MACSYNGLYVQRLSDGTIHNVQAVDTSENSIPLDPDTYIERDGRYRSRPLALR